MKEYIHSGMVFVLNHTNHSQDYVTDEGTEKSLTAYYKCIV